MKRKRTSSNEAPPAEADVLAAEVARLQRQVAEAQSQLAEAAAQALQRMQALQQEVAESFAKAQTGLEAHLQRVRDGVAQLGACATPAAPRTSEAQFTHFIPATTVPRWYQVRLAFIPDEGYLRGELALLLLLAQDGADFTTLLAKLHGEGLLVERKGRWFRAPHVHAANTRLTLENGFGAWRPLLSTAAYEVLSLLQTRGPASRRELHTRLGRFVGGIDFARALNELKTYGLVERPGTVYWLSDALLAVYGAAPGWCPPG